MYVRFAEWIKEGGSIGKEPELGQDMLEPTVEWNIRGQQQLAEEGSRAEPARQIDRLGDAAALTFAHPVAAAASVTEELEKFAGLRVGSYAGHDEFGFGLP